MHLNFYKYQGTGNDFVILDNRDKAHDHLTQQQVKHLCDRRFGIGADGLMLLNLLDGYDFEMKYYNADGRESSMCGNGGRCLVQFAKDMGIEKDVYSFLAIDGPHEATFDEQGWVRLKMKDVDSITDNVDHKLLNTGSPHYVKFVDDLASMDVVSSGKAIRYNDVHQVKGINVNFVERQTEGIAVRTYERGVEDETYSCGTGVTACALVAAPNADGTHRVSITTPGGQLAVEFDKNQNKYSNIWLCGPATFVFKGEIEIVD
ncbi:diaminopimelate epimerase [Aridibaculum aurantiacum]|uniref:diaminopimelate epimerase n=1 Tax=Aridibaculum aurantiacum TaxID=2810307 RepID=UPI001A96AF24|nr:diaminopimelate epimerase [Aridibaculum aurantiacum]